MAGGNNYYSSYGSWGKKHGGWREQPRRPRQQKPYVMCTDPQCGNWAFEHKNTGTCQQCNAPMHAPAKGGLPAASGVTPDPLSVLRALRELLSPASGAGELAPPLRKVLEAAEAGIHAGDVAPVERPPEQVTWYAAKAKAIEAKNALYKVEQTSEKLRKQITTAQKQLDDLQAKLAESTENLRQAREVHDQAYSVFHAIPEPDTDKPKKAAPVASAAGDGAKIKFAERLCEMFMDCREADDPFEVDQNDMDMEQDKMEEELKKNSDALLAATKRAASLGEALRAKKARTTAVDEEAAKKERIEKEAKDAASKAASAAATAAAAAAALAEDGRQRA